MSLFLPGLLSSRMSISPREVRWSMSDFGHLKNTTELWVSSALSTRFECQLPFHSRTERTLKRMTSASVSPPADAPSHSETVSWTPPDSDFTPKNNELVESFTTDLKEDGEEDEIIRVAKEVKQDGEAVRTYFFQVTRRPNTYHTSLLFWSVLPTDRRRT